MSTKSLLIVFVAFLCQPSVYGQSHFTSTSYLEPVAATGSNNYYDTVDRQTLPDDETTAYYAVSALVIGFSISGVILFQDAAQRRQDLLDKLNVQEARLIRAEESVRQVSHNANGVIAACTALRSLNDVKETQEYAALTTAVNAMPATGSAPTNIATVNAFRDVFTRIFTAAASTQTECNTV